MSLRQTQVTYTEALANLDELCEQVISDRDTIIITRKDGENVALIAADELASLLETLHLLRSPNRSLNARYQSQKIKRLLPKSC
ncbi:MAG: type II toxin-antitoxin system Phd/YefM family antitoxin [Microcoleus sp. PH2017_17_BER_D_A]|nr:type II toxin-antitoxin system Phd/YefM family antitoxin [Microcoleus sp. PH2017_17_BER_D_A]